MFDLGSGEVLLLLLVVFLIYGPHRIPDLARKLGKIARDVRGATEEVKRGLTIDPKDHEPRE